MTLKTYGTKKMFTLNRTESQMNIDTLAVECAKTSLEAGYEFMSEKSFCRGDHTSLFLARNNKISQTLVAKVYKKNIFTERHKSLYNQQYLLEFDHPNIIKHVFAYEGLDHHIIYIEPLKCTDLHTFLVEKGIQSENSCRNIFKQLVNALKYVHSFGVIHNNIKLENILIDDDMKVYLTGFTYSFHLNFQGELLGEDSKTNYTSPEVLIGEKPSFSSDIYSLGIVLYLLMFGVFPTNENYDVINPDHPLKDLFCNFFQEEKSERISIEDIKKHHWL